MEQFTKEQLIKKAQEQIGFCRHTMITGEGRAHVNQCAALFEIALAALTAEPVAWLWTTQLGERDVSLLSPDCDENAADALASGWSYQTLVLSADDHQASRPEEDNHE